MVRVKEFNYNYKYKKVSFRTIYSSVKFIINIKKNIFLTIGNKLDLIRLLFPIAHKWRKIGEALSINYGDLENLRTERSDNADRLSAVIQIWFDKQTSPVKWSTVIIAVELPPVYEPRVAENILQKCVSIKQN